MITAISIDRRRGQRAVLSHPIGLWMHVLRATGVFVLFVMSSGCVEGGSSDVEKIGRYEFHQIAGGLEIRESSTGLSRLLDALFGRTSHVKIRLGTFAPGEPDYAPAEIAEVVVRKRRLKGPATKPNASRRPFEVRLIARDETELPPFFYFRHEGEAREFAARFEQALQSEGQAQPS